MKFGGANANNSQLGYNFSRRKATNLQVIVYSLVAFIVSRLHIPRDDYPLAGECPYAYTKAWFTAHELNWTETLVRVLRTRQW